MKPFWHRALEPDLRPPHLAPSWTTWMWLGLAVAVLVGVVVGLYYAATPYVIR